MVYILKTSWKKIGKNTQFVTVFLYSFLKVTADFHVIQATSGQILFTIFTVGGFLRTLYGPMPFWPTFTWIEMVKWMEAFSCGVTNVSAFLQMSLVMDFR